MSRAAASDSIAGAVSTRAIPSNYFERSESPLASLIFLLPLIVLYEIGTQLHWTDAFHGESQAIRAFIWMQRFFRYMGASAQHLPALAIVGILLAWHVARNDTWRISPATLLGMAVESALLSVPLIAVGSLVYGVPNISWNALHLPAAGSVVLRLGAGVYEELLFRLILFTLLSLLLRDLLRLRKRAVCVLLVLISAVLFSAYHYLGNEPFDLRNFVFRTLAGVYFGLLFLVRGFGITAGAHAAYDLFLLLAYASASPR